MTSASRRRASATDARPRRKSPANTAILLPNAIFAEGAERRWVDVSITSSCRRDAVCMSSVISARRRWEGRMSESSEVYAVSIEEFERGFASGEDGLMSDRIALGVIGLSMVVAVGIEGSRETLGVRDVARDMSRTRRGRICLPSDCV